MKHEKILRSPYRVKIDIAIEAGYTPSIIREGLSREGSVDFTLEELTAYVEEYYQTMLQQSMSEQEELYTELSSSIPVLLADRITDSSKKVTYQSLLELDVLRSEKAIQDLMAGRPVGYDLQAFERLTRIKSRLITSITTFLEYKKAIQEAHAAQHRATRVDFDRLGPYLERLSDRDRSIALDLMNIIMDSRSSDDAVALLPDASRRPGPK